MKMWLSETVRVGILFKMKNSSNVGDEFEISEVRKDIGYQ